MFENSLNINFILEFVINIFEFLSLIREIELVERKELREKVRKFVYLIRNYNGVINVKLSVLVVIMFFVIFYLLKIYFIC